MRFKWEKRFSSEIINCMSAPAMPFMHIKAAIQLKNTITGYTATIITAWISIWYNLNSRPFPSCFEPHYESEAMCKVFIMKISFHSNANKTDYHMKSFALSLAFIMKFIKWRHKMFKGWKWNHDQQVSECFIAKFWTFYGIILWSIRVYIISWILHALWLVLTYDLWEDRRMDDVTINNFYFFII